MTIRAASRRAHQRFCEIEGWMEVRNSRGTSTQHHITYELQLDDGGILRTRISRPANTEQYGKSLWTHILADQLCITEAEFWECVDKGNPPKRATHVWPPTAKTLPARLAYQLVKMLKLTNEEIAELSLEEALELMEEYWGRPREFEERMPDVLVSDVGYSQDPTDEVRAVLIPALDMLTSEQKIVISLRYFEGLDDSAIAVILGTPTHSVSASASSALATLKTALAT